jgi:hypothetical protein
LGSGERQRGTCHVVAPEDGQKNCPKHVELILEINKSLLLHLVGLSVLFTYVLSSSSSPSMDLQSNEDLPLLNGLHHVSSFSLTSLSNLYL